LSGFGCVVKLDVAFERLLSAFRAGIRIDAIVAGLTFRAQRHGSTAVGEFGFEQLAVCDCFQGRGGGCRSVIDGGFSLIGDVIAGSVPGE
jgi:hypothetical protein